VPVSEIDLTIDAAVLPDKVAAFLDEAQQRVRRFVRQNPALTSGFVPSDFATVYRALRAIAAQNLAPGNLFCEWGSGYGGVACLAAMLEFDACGIEIEGRLVDAARRLAADFGVAVEFVQGSFIPRGGERFAEEAHAEHDAEFFWLVTDADQAFDELGFDPDDIDLVFAYPWPGEECLVENLFERYAADGALLLTYNQYDTVRLVRKVGGRSGEPDAIRYRS